MKLLKPLLMVIAVFTLCFSASAQTLSYTNFETGTLEGWNLVNGSSKNSWTVGMARCYNSNYGAYISNDGGTTNGYNTSSPGVVHMYKDIDFSTAGTSTFLTFKWSSLGEINADYLKVHLVSTNTTPVEGQELTEGDVGRSEYSGIGYFRGARISLSNAISAPTMRLVLSWTNDGANGEQPPASVDDIEVYSANYNFGTWTTKTPMSGARYYASTLRYGYSLVMSGGYISGGSTNETLEYNMVSGRWGALPNRQNTTSLAAGVKFNGAIWNIGGFLNSSSTPTDEVKKFDLSNFSWSTAGTFSYKLFYGRALTFNRDYLYVVGGSDDSNNLRNDVNYMDKNSLTWHSATPIPGDGRADGGAAITDNHLIYIGGFTNSFEKLQVDSIFIGTINPNNPSEITWTTGANFPGGPRARFYAYPWGTNQVIVVGGSDNGTGGFPSFSDMWVYNIDTDTWKQLPSKPTPITAYQGASYRLENNIWKLVITGGVTTGPALTTVTEEYVDTVDVVTGVEDLKVTAPTDYVLEQNYPNPFNPSTSIQFSIPVEGFVSLEIFNTLGEKISTLVSGVLKSGSYSYKWNASNFSSGVYFYQLKAGNFVKTGKMLLMK